MKTKNESICVYRNEIFEEKTKSELETARQILQRLLNLWNGLEIGEIRDINELLMNPEKVYQDRINTFVLPQTSGRFAVKKSAVINTLELPDASELYSASKAIRQQPYCASSNLWNIEGNQVVLNEAESENLIDSQSIYASDPDKIKLAKDLMKLAELYNSLNQRLSGELISPTPWTYNHFRGKFIINQEQIKGMLMQNIAVDPGYLKRCLSL